MQKATSLSQAAIAHGGTLMFPDCQFTSVSIDSRTIEKGDLFVALEGDKHDGHQFLPAVSGKASGLVVRQAAHNLTLPQWVVPDTTLALGQLARMHRDKFEGVVVAVTGSSGKTTVKEMLAAIFSEAGSVSATRGNLNNHIGVPLTLLELKNKDDFAVVEMGASGPDEISYLCSLAWPDVVLVNNVMPAHVEGFGSIEGVAKAKGEIYSGVNPGGTAIINLDEPFAEDWRNRSVAIRTFGFSMEREDADFRANNVQLGQQGESQFELVTSKGNISIQLGLTGKHNIANALAAAACAYGAGVGLDVIAAGLGKVGPVAGRLSLHKGINDSTVIDDSYNANPGSVKAGIDSLMSFPGKKLLVLGDMGELGKDEMRWHGEVGIYAAQKGIDQLLGIGELSINTVRECIAAGGNAEHFTDKSTLVEKLKSLLAANAVVLVKGSRSAAMDEVVNSVLEKPASNSGSSIQRVGG